MCVFVFSADSCADTSMQSLAEEPLAVQDELCVPEYTGDIYRHLREREVRGGLVLNCRQKPFKAKLLP